MTAGAATEPDARPAPAAGARRSGWPRVLRTTREGKAFIAVTVGVGIAAFNTGNNLMFLVLGFMLSLIVLSGILSELVLRKISVSRRLPRQAFAGQVTLIEVVLRNDKPRAPSYSLEIEDLTEDLPTERRCYFLKVGPGVEQLAAYRRTPPRRGVMRMTGFRVATRYPFGIFEKWRTIACPGELLVYPAPVPGLALAGAHSPLGNQAPRSQLGQGHEVAGLRGYRDGDGARAIHWRRTAALGRLVTIERHTEDEPQLCLRIDNAAEDASDPAWQTGFEYALGQATALVLEQLGKGVSVEVVARGSRSPVATQGGTGEPVLRYLALLQPLSRKDAPALASPRRESTVLEVPVQPRQPGRTTGGDGAQA